MPNARISTGTYIQFTLAHLITTQSKSQIRKFIEVLLSNRKRLLIYYLNDYTRRQFKMPLMKLFSMNLVFNVFCQNEISSTLWLIITSECKGVIMKKYL